MVFILIVLNIFPIFFAYRSTRCSNEQRDILQSISEGRHADRKNIQPVKHVLPKRACRHSSPEVAIGRGDDANVYGNRLAAPDPFEFPLLDHSQQCNLGSHWQLANLVQENCPAVGRFETAEAPLQRSCKGTSLVAKQFGSDQRRRNGRAIYADKGARCAI
jgi:hypothetical protein